MGAIIKTDRRIPSGALPKLFVVFVVLSPGRGEKQADGETEREAGARA